MDDLYRNAFNNFYYNIDEDHKRKNNISNQKLKNKDNSKNNKNSKSHKILLNQTHKTITDINNNIISVNSNTNNNNNIKHKQRKRKTIKIKKRYRAIKSKIKKYNIRRKK